MSAPHQPLPWCRCIKEELLTLSEGKWFAMTSMVPSLPLACCCLLTKKPPLSLSASALLISPVSPSHFSCLCHSLHHILKSSLPHSTAIWLMTDCLKHSVTIRLMLKKDEDSCLQHLCWINIALKNCIFQALHFSSFKKCSQRAKLSAPHSCHPHWTQILFLLRHKICSQIPLESNTDNVAAELFALH